MAEVAGCTGGHLDAGVHGHPSSSAVAHCLLVCRLRRLVADDRLVDLAAALWNRPSIPICEALETYCVTPSAGTGGGTVTRILPPRRPMIWDRQRAPRGPVSPKKR